MAVSFYDFKRVHHHDLKKKILSRFEEIMEDNSFIEGKYNQSFEKRFGEMVGAKYCLLVANGTDALEIALQAYGIGYGHKVGIPGVTFYATAEAVLNVGATPILVDVNPSTGLMCPESLKRILKNTHLDAIMPVHIYGMPAPIEELEDICVQRKIKIVEDAAQGHGTKLSTHTVGGGKNITTFSFYPTKNLSAFGDAGAISLQDDQLAQKIISIRNHGRSPKGIQFFGRNSRCDHMHAAVLDAKLDEFKENHDRRRAIASHYLNTLTELPVEFPAKDFLNSSSWHLFPILTQNKETKLALADFLKRAQIGFSLFYEKALGDEIPLLDYPGERVHSQRFTEKVICLPIHPNLTQDELNEVSQKLKEFYHSSSSAK